MDKEEIIKLAVDELSLKINSIDKFIEKAEKEKQEAPSAMQSWSDTSRFQAGAMVEEMEKEKGRLLKHLNFLETLPAENKKKVELGSLVEVKDLENGKASFYFVSLFADAKIKYRSQTISFVSKDSPIIKLLLNKKINDKIKIEIGSNIREVEIKSIL